MTFHCAGRQLRHAAQAPSALSSCAERAGITHPISHRPARISREDRIKDPFRTRPIEAEQLRKVLSDKPRILITFHTIWALSSGVKHHIWGIKRNVFELLNNITSRTKLLRHLQKFFEQSQTFNGDLEKRSICMGFKYLNFSYLLS